MLLLLFFFFFFVFFLPRGCSDFSLSFTTFSSLLYL